MSITIKALNELQTKLRLRFKQARGCCPNIPGYQPLLLVDGEKHSSGSSSDEDDDIWVCIPNALYKEHFGKGRCQNGTYFC